MSKFALFISCGLNEAAHTKLRPVIVEAISEEEACRTAAAVADAVGLLGYPDVLVQVVGGCESGRVIGEIRRPLSA